jgi:two-component system response regulator AtoC
MATITEVSTSLSGRAGSLPPDAVIFGQSDRMQEVREKIKKVSGSNVPVLIQGESGTGKEIVARLIHQQSPWGAGPLVKVNCPAIPKMLLESELFGYEKGAFTGAYGNKSGQAKLLELLQDGQFCRIGAQESKKIDVRIVCATNRRLEQEVEAGTFRQDLFYRINVINMLLPPLRERRSDISDLVDYFLEFYNQSYRRNTPPLSAVVLQLMESYHWPGNIRQLENLMKRYVILSSEEAITSGLLSAQQKLPVDEVMPNGSISLKKLTRQAVRELEWKIILKVLQANQWSRKRAARALNISYRALLYKIKDAGLPTRRAQLSARNPVINLDGRSNHQPGKEKHA